MNGDGIPDLFLGERDGWVNFYKRNSDGTLDPAVRLQTASGDYLKTETNSYVVVLDWNGDDVLDILLGCEDASENNGSLVRVYLNEGTSTNYSFADEQLITTSNGDYIADPLLRISLQAEDLNEDGLVDLVIGDGSADIVEFHFFENIGTIAKPSLVKRGTLTQPDGTPIQLVKGAKGSFVDWNNDGVLDLLTGNGGAETLPIDLYLGVRPE